MDGSLIKMSEEADVTTSSPVNSSDGPFVCDNKEMNYFIHSSFVASVIIIIILSFMNRRVHLNTDCCGAKPGLAVPINLLDDFDNRWSYACSFGAITNTIVVIYLGPQYFGFQAPQVAKVFVGLVTALEVCIIYFPLFACIRTHHIITGSMIGFVYSVTWLLASIRQLVKCTLDPIPEVLPYAGLVLTLPNIICLTGVATRFLFNFIRACWDKIFIRQEFKHNIAEVWHINYVRQRINCRDQMEEKRCEKVSEFIRKYIYEKKSHFKYSSRIICSLFVVICCTYQFGLLYMLSNAYFTQWANQQVDHLVNVSGLPRNDTLITNLYTSVTMLNISWIVATGISLALFAINIIFIVFKYRKDTIKLFRGQKEFIPTSIQKQDNSLTIRNCMLFAGFQIAYMIWGYFVLNFVLWVLAVLFCLLIVLPLMNGITDIVRFFANFCIVPLLVSVTLRYIQTIMSRKFFLQDKIEKDDKYKPLALNNRQAFHLANYFFFMANIETGLFSCLYRILQGLVFGLIFLGRLDRCVLMAGLETQDIGYNAYLGMLFTEHTHNNPVLRVFCHLLMENVRGKKITAGMDGYTVENHMEEETGSAEPEVKAKELIAMEEGCANSCSEQENEFIETKEREGLRQSEENVETYLNKSDPHLTKEFIEAEQGRVEQTKELVETEEKVVVAEIEKMKVDVLTDNGETDKLVQTQDTAQDKDQKKFSKSLQENKNGVDGEIDHHEATDESDQPETSKATKRSAADKSRIARYRWHILLTLVNNPQLTGCRKQKPEKKTAKKGKKKNMTKEDQGNSMSAPLLFRYEQYRKLKEEIRELEVQIFGSGIQKKLISIGCQPSEDFGFASQMPEFSESLKRNIDGSSCPQDSMRNSYSKTENIGSSDKPQQTRSRITPKDDNNQLRPHSWSDLKTGSLDTDFSLADGSLKFRNGRIVRGPTLTTDARMDRHASVSDDTVIYQTSF